MSRQPLTLLGIGLLLLALTGCSGITDPRLLTDFDWGEVEDPETVVEGISTAVALGELFILGQMSTPTRCYKLQADFKRKGSELTVRVNARSNDSPNCDQSIGGFRYTAVMSNLKFQTYNLRVIHDITGAAGGEYSTTVVIR